MPRAAGSKKYFQFTRGKITEANLLTFPEDAMSDESNIDIEKDGSIRRRRGLDFETGYDLTSGATGISSLSASLWDFDTYLWKNVNPDETTTKLDILVVRYGPNLHFYDATSTSFTSGYLGSLNFYSATDDFYRFLFFYYPVDMTSGKNKLFVASKLMSPFYVEYDGSTFTKTSITVEVRDFTGVDDGLAVDERPTSDVTAHRYNLYNQGWAEPRLHYDTSSPTPVDMVDEYYRQLNEYPSNTEIWHITRRAQADGQLLWDPTTVQQEGFGNSRAPTGHYILNVFTMDRDAASGLTGLSDSDKLTSAFSTTAFFAGRVWYAGGDDRVYFSQIIKEDADIGKCYQEQDPTAEDFNELLATDGGVIRITEANEIIKLIPVGKSLLVFAENGIWLISGSDGIAFTADSFSVTKLSEVGTFFPRTLIQADGSIIFWSDTGIYAVTSDPTTGQLGVTSISANTIQSDFKSIPHESKKVARGFYDTVNNKAYWLYPENASDAKHTTLVSNDTVLILNTATGSFNTYNLGFLDTDTPIPLGIIKKSDSATVITDATVEDNSGNTVVDGSGDTVVTPITGVSSNAAADVSVITLADNSGTYSLTFSEFKDRSFVDWKTADGTGVDYSSYIETGYENLGEPHLDKQATYVFCYFNRTEDGFEDNGSGGVILSNQSSCLMRAKWEWTNYDVGRWSDSVEVYRLRRPYVPTGTSDPFNYGFQVVETKNKVRGKGKALTLRFESSTGKDFQLLGWAIPFTLSGAA